MRARFTAGLPLSATAMVMSASGEMNEAAGPGVSF